MEGLHHIVVKSRENQVPKKNAASMASDEAKVIAKHFSRYLKPEIANSDVLKEQVYKLRHQVYCEELHFEDSNTEQLEYDEFDARAIHCVIRHLSSNLLAGTLRLVCTRNRNELLPLEKFCAQAITHSELTPNLFPRHQVCEISRLAVPAMFRKRQLDQFVGSATGAINELTFSTHELRYFPYIAISLYMSALAICHKNRQRHIFVMMEPRLARSLDFVGIHFAQIGPLVEYHGKRAAYYIDEQSIKVNLNDGYKSLLSVIEAELLRA